MHGATIKKWNHKLYSSCNIIRLKKYGTMRYHVASKRDEKFATWGIYEEMIGGK